MAGRTEDLGGIKDHAGWALGMKAWLKATFGTDLELRIRDTGVAKEVDRAQREVVKMSAAAEGLLKTLNGGKPEDLVADEFQDILQRLDH